MTWVAELFRLGVESLLALGKWVETSPITAIVLVIVGFIALSILNKLLGLLKAVLLVVLAVITIGLFVHFTEPWLGWLWVLF